MLSLGVIGNTDAAPYGGHLRRLDLRGFLSEQADQTAGRFQRQQHQAQQAGLAGSGWPGKELE
jgi:hypothetical protein